MEAFKRRTREQDAEGMCVTHNQTMLLEPCWDCLREDWADLEAERNKFAAEAEVLQLQLDCQEPGAVMARSLWEARIRRDEQLRVLAAAEKNRCMGMGIEVITLNELHRAITDLNTARVLAGFIDDQLTQLGSGSLQ